MPGLHCVRWLTWRLHWRAQITPRIAEEMDKLEKELPENSLLGNRIDEAASSVDSLESEICGGKPCDVAWPEAWRASQARLANQTAAAAQRAARLQGE